MKAMKFIAEVNSPSCYGRKATISNLTRLPCLVVDTPALMIFTKSGSVPHLTREVLSLQGRPPGLLQAPLAHMLPSLAGLLAHKQGLAAFVGLAEFATFLQPTDPTKDAPQGHDTGNECAFWTRRGKLSLNAEGYMKAVETLQPDLYVAMCDANTAPGSSKKRQAKAARRSLHMLEECVRLHLSSPHLATHSQIIGPVVGGYDLEERKSCLKGLLEVEQHLAGFMMEGLNFNGPEVEDMEFTTVKDVVEQVQLTLPQSKLHIMPGCWNPFVLVELVCCGWDLFDTSLPLLATERGSVLVFSFHIDGEDNADARYQLDLQDASYKEDFSPILEGCACLACQKHTRAYINHLLNTRELLAQVLLMIHNLHHYEEFFKAIRQVVGTEKILKLKTLLSRQWQEHAEGKTVQETKPKVSLASKRQRRLSERSSPES